MSSKRILMCDRTPSSKLRYPIERCRVMCPSRWRCILCISLLLPGLVRAQGSSCLRRLIPVSFSDERSAPMVEAQFRSLRAESHGKSIPIVSLSPPDQRHRVILLIDASGSMRDKWSIAMALAMQFADGRPSPILLALYIYGKDAGEQVPFSEDGVTERLKAIERDPSYVSKHVFGMTGTADAIVESLKMFGRPQLGDAIFLITDDSGDNASRVEQNVVASALIADGVRLISCIIPDRTNAAPAVAAPADILSWISVQTGGFISEPFRTIISARTEGELLDELRDVNPDAAKLLYAQITESQILEIDLPAPIRKEQSWKLEFVDESSSRGHLIYYPHKLTACRTSP